MRNDRRCPKEVKRAVRALARAVKLVADISETPSPHPQAEYHAREYLNEMETLFLQQLMTAYWEESEREQVLIDFGLDYLMEALQEMHFDWELDLKSLLIKIR